MQLHSNWHLCHVSRLGLLAVAFLLQTLLPLLERVRELSESNPRLRQDLQPLLQRVDRVLHDCHTCMQQWNKHTGASGVSKLDKCLGP